MWACEAGDNESVAFMLSAHPSLIKATNYKQDHETGLMGAAYGRKFKTVKKLLTAGAQINVQDSEGRTALSCTVSIAMCARDSNNYREVIEFLLNANARIDISDREGKTVLYLLFLTIIL